PFHSCSLPSLCFHAPPPSEISTLSLHDALPICADEAGPEILQHLLPGDLVVGDAVELLLQIRREIVLDIAAEEVLQERDHNAALDRKSTRLNSSHLGISYAVFCLKKKKNE